MIYLTIYSLLWLTVRCLFVNLSFNTFYSLGLIYALLLALVLGSTDGTTVEPSIAHSVFLPPEFDPFVDSYMDAVTRMSSAELMRLPKLSDMEFLDQLTRGIDSIPGKKKETVRSISRENCM
jgi:hypothetical protein